MFKTMTAAGEGTGRTQPINGLDELLPLPGKAGKATRSLPPNTGEPGISSFTQMLTEGLLSLTAAAGQSLPLGKVSALTPVAEDKPAVDLTAQLTTAGDAQLPQPVVNKAAAGKEGNLPVAGEIDPNIIISLFTAAPFFPGTVPTTNEGVDDKLPQSDESAIEAGPFPSVPSSSARRGSDESVGPYAAPRGERYPLLALQPIWQVETPPKTSVAGQQAVAPPGEASRGRKAISLTGFSTPPQWVDQPADGVPVVKSNGITPSLTPAVENITNQAAAISTTIIAQPEKTTVAGRPAVAPPGEASRGREAISLTGLSTPPQWVDQPADGVPVVKSNGIAPSLPPAVENITNQATAISTAINAQPGKTPVAGRQAVAPPGEANRGREAISLTGLSTPPQWVHQPADGAPIAKSDGIAPSLPPAVESITNQAAAISAAIIAQPEKAPVIGRPAAEPPGEASREQEVTLLNNIRESLVKTGLDELVAPKGDAKKDPFMGDKVKPHSNEPFAAPEIMDINANTAGAPLSKGQDIAVPTTSLLAQVAEQLPQVISKGSGRIRLSLAPDNLGKLDMDLVVRENRVQIVLTAESRTVQQTLQGHVEQLKDALQQQGLEVDGFNVLLQNGRQGQGDTAGGNPLWSEYNRAAADKKGAGNDNFLATTTPFVPGQSLKKGAEGINIFI